MVVVMNYNIVAAVLLVPAMLGPLIRASYVLWREWSYEPTAGDKVAIFMETYFVSLLVSILSVFVVGFNVAVGMFVWGHLL